MRFLVIPAAILLASALGLTIAGAFSPAPARQGFAPAAHAPGQATVPDTVTYVNLSPGTPLLDQLGARVGQGPGLSPAGDTVLLLTASPRTSQPLAQQWIDQHPGTRVLMYLPPQRIGPHLAGH